MKLLFVTHHSDFVGGGELSQLQLLQALHKQGEDVALAVPTSGWCEKEAKKYGVPVLHLPMPAIGPLMLFSTVRSWVKQLSDIEKPDAIHANTPRSCFYASLIGRWLGIPVLFHCRIADRDPKLDWILVRLVRCVVTNSETTAKRFKRFKHLNVHMVYNGVDVDDALTQRHCERPFGAGQVLLCVGRISRWKRHDIVLDTFEALASKLDGLHLVCVGAPDPFEPDWWDELQRRTGQSEFADRIHWPGMQEDMAPWYQGADVLMLASEREPFGRVIVEAMAYGLPVAAFNRGGPAEIMEDGIQGVLLEERDKPAERLLPLLTDEALRKVMGDAGRKRAKDFSLGHHVHRMHEIFEAMAKGG